VAQYLDVGVIDASKVRDVKTGEILYTSVNYQEGGLKGKNVLIVDDICDGGRTFIELARVLENYNEANSVDLYVTHGIFSKGLGVFDGLIDKIYTPNSWIEEQGILTILQEN